MKIKDLFPDCPPGFVFVRKYEGWNIADMIFCAKLFMQMDRVLKIQKELTDPGPYGSTIFYN